MIKRFAINAGTGVFSQLATAIVGFILLPYAMTRLGTQQYGIYQLGNSTRSLMMFLQLGMGPTLIRFCSKAIAENDTEIIRKIISSAYFIVFIIGFVVLSIGFNLIPTFISFYDIQVPLIEDSTTLLICMLFSLVVNFIILVPQGMLTGANKIDFVNYTIIVNRISLLFGVVFFFEFLSPSLKYFGFATLLSYLMQLGLLISMSVKTVGFSSIFHWKSIHIDYVKKIISFGSLSFINAISSALTWQSPVLICGKILGKEAAAAFAPAQLVSQTIQLLLGNIASPIVPYASRNLIDDGGKNFKSWAVNIGILLAVIGFSLGLPFMICGQELVNFWLGPELIWTWKIIAVMVIGTTIAQIQAVNYFLALGGGDIRPTVHSQVVMAFVVSTGIYIGTAYFNWSLLGVALFFSFCIILRNTIYLAYAYSNQFSYRYSSYLFNVYLIPALFAFFSVFIGYSIKMFLSPVNIFYTGCYILLVNGLYALAGWYVIIPGHVKLIVSEKVRKWKWRM